MNLEERQEEMRQRMNTIPSLRVRQYKPPRRRKPPKRVHVAADHTLAVARTFLDLPAPYLPPERVDISRRLLAELIALAELGAKTKAGESQ